MGCDIHAVLEHKSLTSLANPDPRFKEWQCAYEARISRDYGLFSCLNGVRRYRDEWPEPVVPNRDIPDDLSYVGERVLLSFIVDKRCECGESNRVTKTQADNWLANGQSDRYGDRHITNVDYHSYSWVTLEELKEAYRRYRGYFKDWKATSLPIQPNEDVEVIIASMEALERLGNKTRLVFAYDN